MKTFFVMCLAVLALSACTSTEKGAAVGAVAGTAIGAATTGNVPGAVIGGVVGATAGALLGRVADSDTMCYYRDRNGNTYKAACPKG